MPDLVLIEPAASPDWLPFAHSRPTSELRAGIWLIRERWEAIVGGETRHLIGPSHLHGFVEDGVPPVRAAGPVEGPVVVGRSAFAPSGTPVELGNDPARLMNEGSVVGWWVPSGHTWEHEDFAGDEVEVDGLLLHGAFDLIHALELLLQPDTADFVREMADPIPDGCIVIGDPHEVVILGAAVEPGVIFDVREGPVVLEQHAYVNSGSRLEGPLYVGPASQIVGGRVAWSVVGPHCKVRGEVAHSVFLGFANKGHDGFLGHSVIGRWANLGAGTTTSNLKNTYGPIRLEIAGQRIETGRQFLGSLVGDHAKTAIGTMLPTGTVVGVGANVFGAPRAPKYVPPFAWGDTGDVMNQEGFIRIAERVLPRRHVTVTDDIRAMLDAIYRAATS
ncbi:MAG TPA: putative sugar nucleotidyl transferase [Gemmatimonadales bacterium]